MTTLHFRGVQSDAPGSTLDLGDFNDLLSVDAVGEYRLGDVRGSAGVVQMPLEDDDVVEVALDGGVQLWLGGATLRDLFEATGQQQARDGSLVIPAVLPLGTATRGFGRRAITVLRRLVVRDGKAKVAELGATAIAKRLEDGLLKTPGGADGAGLYACTSPGTLGNRVEGTIDADGAALLFLHGTASRYDGSFGKLPDSVWQRMRQRYGSRIYALQHRTLTESPIANALALLEQIPANATLHIVSHSRGGLIGELLCRVARTEGAPFDDVELDHFRNAAQRSRSEARKAAYAQQAKELAQLSELLQEKKPRIQRFVRVACPANGTTLASGRLDLYFSILLNGVKLVLPGANPVVGFLGATIASVVKTRAQPDVLPGIEAMMPESPLIAVLNRREVEVNADLTVIAGDMEGKGPLGVLKEVVTDLFYRENHDLVVHTRAMVGGTPRTQGNARHAFKKGDGIDHFHYFEMPDTADKVFLGLSRADGSEAGFESITKATADELRTRALQRALRGVRPPANRPVVFLLPGIMGSQLSAGDDRVWVDFLSLARGRFGRLAIREPDNVKPIGLIEKSYQKLSRFLEDSHRVIEFPYDWRRSLSESADRLAREVERVLNETEQPIRFLAHSMGGLVSRTMVARHRDLWRRVSARNGARLVMLGTPNRGSWAVPRVLLGHDRLIKILSIVDLRQNQQELLNTIAGFNGLAEMLPDDAQHDFFGSGWSALDIDRSRPRALPSEAILTAARAARTLLSSGDALDVERMIYVAGTAPATPLGFRTRGSSIEFMATSQGDGTVPWSLGLLDRVPTYYMDAKHGDMANSSRSFAALVELLNTGKTTLLPQEPPAAVRARPELFPLPEDEVIVYPDEDEIESVILRAERGQADDVVDEEPLEVSVVHGNLAFARNPLMVGHYDGDTIAGAEKALDVHLGGWLAERRQLDLYPGPLETSGIFLRSEGARESGAIVMGLGEVGSLTPSSLERAITHAVLSYAAKRVEQAQEKGDADGEIAAHISSLLIGSSQGGMPLDDSLRAIISGVLNARDRLRTAERHARVHIKSLTFVELYEDVALSAVSALNEFRFDRRVRDRIRPVDELITRPGGQRRIRYSEPPGWWNRVEVFENENTGALEFQNLTQRRARAEAFLVPTQRQLIDGFIQDVISSPNPDQATAQSLFELLVPNSLKDYAPDQNHLMLLVDETSARYPWELMTDRNNGNGEPISVRAGLVRNLKVEVFRERPQAVLGQNALVIGDPPSDLPELPGAQEEAQAVADLLSRRHFSVTPLRRPSASAVVNNLFARDYKVLHFAAHGVHLEQLTELSQPRGDGRKTITERISGIVIGPNTVLTPGEIRQMRAVPELVFVNCCHLGRMDDNVPGAESDPALQEAKQRRLRHHLAANIAGEFIRMGVRAVVAAGWAVDDAAALTFARTFYDWMLRGQPFGEAVRAARRATYEEHRSVNTWGAYQCYGDPGYVLRQARDGHGASFDSFSYASRNELIVELENIAHNAETIVQRDLQTEQKRVAALFKWTQDRGNWLDDPRVRLAFANAYRELDMFKDAVACYQEAMAADWTALTIRDLEQYANLRVRDAAADYQLSDRGKKAQETAASCIRSVLKDLQAQPAGATQLPDNVPYFKFGPERLALQASAQKRLSMIQSGSDVFESLRAMESLYRQAHDAAARRKTDAYPTLNWLAAAAVLEIFGLLEQAPDWTAELERVRAIAAAADISSPSFWTQVADVETLIVKALIDDSLNDSINRIVSGYQRAWLQGGTPRKLRSVLDQLDWYEHILGQRVASARTRKAGAGVAAAAPAKARNIERRRASAAAIAQIRQQVAAWIE